MSASIAPTFLQFRAGCLSAIAVTNALRNASMPAITDKQRASEIFRRSFAVAHRLQCLGNVLERYLFEVFEEEISSRYKRGADIAATRLRQEDVDCLCFAVMQSLGAWRNGMFLEPTDKVFQNLLGSQQCTIDFTEFARHLRNEVFRELQDKYGWGLKKV